jgi:hypothetical protein
VTNATNSSLILKVYISTFGNSMSIHPGGRTTPLGFYSNLEEITTNMRHAKIQNFRLVA